MTDPAECGPGRTGTYRAMTSDADSEGGHLERRPHGGQEPGDTDVQAERQEEGVEAEIEEEVVEAHRRELASQAETAIEPE